MLVQWIVVGHGIKKEVAVVRLPVGRKETVFLLGIPLIMFDCPFEFKRLVSC
jgi:hypothetical protein